MAEDKALPRILIVDDSRIVRASVSKRIHGVFEVLEEVDGEDGWTRLNEDPSIQVLISDLSMPRLDGYGLLERIRASDNPHLREMPVIMISGDEDEEARNKAKACGATDFITKGIGTVELLSRLDALVKLASTGRELLAHREQLDNCGPLDKHSGLVTPEYLKHHSRQALSMAERHGTPVSVLVIEIECFDALTADCGKEFASQVVAECSRLLATMVRKEDTVSRTAPHHFTVVSPKTTDEQSRTLATRLNAAMQAGNFVYNGMPMKIGLKFGIANSLIDDWETATHLLDLAKSRTALIEPGASASQAGDNAALLVAAAGMRRTPPPNLEMALALLHAGQADKIKPQSLILLRRMLPLLKHLDAELSLGLPLADIEVRSAETEAPAAPDAPVELTLAPK